MHTWDDETFDWKSLGEAEDYLYNRMTKLARIGVHIKEKYGSIRLSPHFVYNFHSLLYPGYVYNQYRYKWMWTLDVYYGEKVLKWTGLKLLIFKWQKYVYVDTYRRAVQKWPHIKHEITGCALGMDWLVEAGVVDREEK